MKTRSSLPVHEKENKVVSTLSLVLATMGGVVAIGCLYVLVPRALFTWQRYRNKRVVKCPDTGGLAEVDIDARGAAFSSIFRKPLLKMKNCTLWPKRTGCDEECVKDLR
jgi:hypothetical protein